MFPYQQTRDTRCRRGHIIGRRSTWIHDRRPSEQTVSPKANGLYGEGDLDEASKEWGNIVLSFSCSPPRHHLKVSLHPHPRPSSSSTSILDSLASRASTSYPMEGELQRGTNRLVLFISDARVDVEPSMTHVCQHLKPMCSQGHGLAPSTATPQKSMLFLRLGCCSQCIDPTSWGTRFIGMTDCLMTTFLQQQ